MKQAPVVMLSTMLLLLCCSLSKAQITGSGTADYIPIWTGKTTQGNSVIYQTATGIGVGTTTPHWELDVAGHINTSGGYLIGETTVLATPGGASGNNLALGYGAMIAGPTGTVNTAVGAAALQGDTTGYANTALGANSLEYNTGGVNNTANGASVLYANSTGSENTGTGVAALTSNTTGSNNTATGVAALWFNTTGQANTANGAYALYENTTGSFNIADGYGALNTNNTGSNNTASGLESLFNNTTGNNNIAIGYSAAYNVSGSNSNNIHIGSLGASGDSGVIRIGTIGTQSSFFVAGVRGVTTGDNDAVPVVIDANGQFGTVSSSRRSRQTFATWEKPARACCACARLPSDTRNRLPTARSPCNTV